MTSVEAAALTEQIAGLLAEHRSMRLGKLVDPRQWECWCGHELGPLGIDDLRLEDDHRAHLAAEIAARLADSRPVVSEAAIEAAVKAMVQESNQFKPASYDRMARAALTAALPHMGDGKGEAEHERVLQGVKDCWKVDMRENRLLRDGIEKLADELEQQHKDAFGESLADNFPSALVTDLRDLLNPPRLSPTGDDTP